MILLTLLLLMVLWVNSVRENTARLREIVEEFEEAQSLSRMRDTAYQRAIALHRMQAMTDPFAIDEEVLRFRSLFETFVEARDEFLSYPLGEDEFAEWERAKEILNQGGAAQSRVAALMMSGEREEAAKILLEQVVSTQDDFMAILTGMMDAELEKVEKEMAVATAEATSTYILVSVLGTVALLLGAMTIVIARRTDRTEAALVTQGERIRALYDVSAVPGLTTEEQIERTLELGCRLLGMEIGKVCRIELEANENRFLHVYAHKGLDVQAGTVMPLDKTFCSITFTTGEPLAIHDVATSKYAKQFSHLAAYIATAIALNGKRYGTINFSSNHPRPTPFTATDKDLVNLIGSWVSVTLERKYAQDELREAKEVAEDANRTKSAFLANMSHELRTPLNAILGYAELIQEEAEAAHHQQYQADLERIMTSGRHLLALINDVLDLSKIEAGKMQVNIERFAVRGACQEVLDAVLPLMKANDNRIESICPDEIGDITVDRTMLKQILFNLLSNASKFTDNGVIRFRAWREETPEGSTISFEVQDTGIGMTEEQLGRVFDIFAQADARTRGQFGGTGLGLAISRHMARIMGGDITAKSRPGEGSAFIVTLPVVARVEETAADA